LGCPLAQLQNLRLPALPLTSGYLILENSMKNQERVNEVYENILSNKLFEALEEKIEIEDQYIPKETLVAEYNELMGHKHSHEEE